MSVATKEERSRGASRAMGAVAQFGRSGLPAEAKHRRTR
jgi:hypothetical protein